MLVKLLRDPFGLVKRIFLKNFVFPFRYGTKDGYDAAYYWQDRFKNHGMSIKGVGCEGLSEEDNIDLRKHALGILHDICQKQCVDFDKIHLLEVGCGNGFYTDYFCKMGVKSYTGVDITDVLFDELMKKYPTYNFIKKDVTVNTIENRYNFIVMMDVIQHIVTKGKLHSALKNISNCLEVGGIFIVAPVTGMSKRHLFHVHCWSARDVGSLLSENFQSELISFREKEKLLLFKKIK